MFTGPKIVSWLTYGPGKCGDRKLLARIQKLVDNGNCNAIFVQSFCRLSRSRPRLWSFLEGLKATDVRLVSLSDGFDSSTKGWSAALAELAL